MARTPKTHCARGHPYDESNTIIRHLPDGTTRRDCRMCHRERDRRTHRRNKTARYVAALVRMIHTLGACTFEDGLVGLEVFDQLKRELTAAERQAIDLARDRGLSDTAIGEQLGISQQAVSKRWPGHGKYLGLAERFHRRPAVPAEQTDEGETT